MNIDLLVMWQPYRRNLRSSNILRRRDNSPEHGGYCIGSDQRWKRFGVSTGVRTADNNASARELSAAAHSQRFGARALPAQGLCMNGTGRIVYNNLIYLEIFRGYRASR
jgi:hypothetical protein